MALGWLFKKRCSASELANELVQLAFRCDPDVAVNLAEAATQCGVDPAIARREHMRLRIWCIETALHDMCKRNDRAQAVLQQWAQGISEHAKGTGYSDDFWEGQRARTAHYDAAWTSAHPPTAFLNAIHALCGVPENEWQLPGLLPIYLSNWHLMLELTKYLRRLAIR